MPINYNPTTWVNNQDPPISADNLNHIEQGIKSTADRVDELVTVEANPSSSATDRLTGLEVDGTVYEVGGGHKVYTDGGTLLPQQPNMVVKGVYSKDNAADSMTEIEVVREFQNDAEVQALTGEAAKGFQHTPDNIYRARAAADITFDPTNTLLTQTRMQEAMEELDAEHLPYSSTHTAKQAIEEAMYYKAGDTYEIPTGYQQFPARLGWSRGKVLISFYLPKIIQANLASTNISFPSSIAVYARDESRNCTVSAISVASISENMISLIVEITPATAWSTAGDSIAIVETPTRTGEKIKFTFS